MQPVPFFDLSRQIRSLRAETRRAFESVTKSAAFSGGAFVSAFENDFARYVGTSHSLGLNSGTDAVHLALAALGITAGDEVIVPGNTFIASAWGISYLGATPVFVDCLPDTWQIDPSAVERVITKRTKAIIAVHLYGVPCDLGALAKVARKYSLAIVEDCAQAHGARYGKKRIGSIGIAGAFSFYPSKNLGAYGEGGALTTNSEKIARRVRLLRSHGEEKKYHHDIVGHNMRMDGIQAAILSLKLKHLDEWLARKAVIVKKYRTQMKNPAVRLQTIPKDVTPALHLFVVTVQNRKKFIAHLDSLGIKTAIHYPIPCHLQKAYRALGYHRGDLPNAEYHANHCVSLPLFPEMRTDEINRVIRAVNSYTT